MKIGYIEKGKPDLDKIVPLWEMQKEYHRALSKHFSGNFVKMTWTTRRNELIKKSEGGFLRLDVATSTDTSTNIGYCISTVSKAGQGELDSIFILSEYRKHGIGDRLMRRALTWMDEKHARAKILIVGAGNEQVFSFYSRYGFYPRSIVLEQVEGTLWRPNI